jgi:GNAT superfamily N-acetyltransferase
MTEEYDITYLDEPAWQTIGRAIKDYNKRQAGDDRAKSLCFVLRAPDQAVVGGVIGEIHWDWLFIHLLWVKEDLRGRGYGHRLLVLLEDEARNRGARNAHVDTFSFQAPDFYRQHGYQVFGALQDFPLGHQRYYLVKQL